MRNAIKIHAWAEPCVTLAYKEPRPYILWFFCYWFIVWCTAVRSKAVALFLLTCLLGVSNCSMFCCTLLYVHSSFASSWWGRESWLLCLVCLPGVSCLLCGSSSRGNVFVCSLWLWYFLIIIFTNFFCFHCVCFFVVWSLFCNVVLSVISSFVIISLRKRAMVALRWLCFCCCVSVCVLCLFLKVPCIGLWSVIVTFTQVMFISFSSVWLECSLKLKVKHDDWLPAD